MLECRLPQTLRNEGINEHQQCLHSQSKSHLSIYALIVSLIKVKKYCYRFCVISSHHGSFESKFLKTNDLHR